KPAVAYVDAGYAGLPNGTHVTYPYDGNAGTGPHVIGLDAFGSMQAGVDSTLPGRTLNVAPCTYHELVHVTVPLTINGPNAGLDPRTTCNGSAVRGAEAIIDGNGTETAIEFDSSGITLDGFTIQNGTADAAHSGVDLHNGFDNNVVQYNIITNNNI